MQCRKCKAELPEDWKFCPHCGTRQGREPRKVLKRANGTGTAGSFTNVAKLVVISSSRIAQADIWVMSCLCLDTVEWDCFMYGSSTA